MFDRASVKFEMYTKLNKTSVTRGFYSDDKANSAIQESLDFLATEMFLADNGYLKKMDLLDTGANTFTLEVPLHMSMIMEVRYLVGNVYIPLTYDSEFMTQQWSQVSGVVQFPSRYKIVDNRFYFNPPLGVGGAQYLQVEYLSYPKTLRQDSDKFEQQFDRAMMWWIVYNSISTMATTMGQFQKPWADAQAMWYAKVVQIIGKRNQQWTAIADFEGY